MSDTEVREGREMVHFPDGTSKLFRGSGESIKTQTKAYWGSKHPAKPAAPPVPEVTDKQVDEFRLKYFNTFNSKANIPNEAAHALAVNPQDPKWRPAVDKWHPVARKAVEIRAKEISEEPVYEPPANPAAMGAAPIYRNPGTGERTAIPQPHEIIGKMTHGPEGYRQLEKAVGAIPEITKLAESSLDPANLAMMLAGGGIAAKFGKLGQVAVTASLYGMGAKGAYDKAKKKDYGGAAVDAALPFVLHGAAKVFGKFRAGKAPAAEPAPVKPPGLGSGPDTEQQPYTPPPNSNGKPSDAGYTAPEEPPQPKPKSKPKPPPSSSSKSKTSNRKPFSQEQDEPHPPPAYSDKAAWTAYRDSHAQWKAYRDSHAQWKADANSNVPPKNPYESYDQWESRRTSARNGPSPEDQAREQAKEQAREQAKAEQDRQDQEQKQQRAKDQEAKDKARRDWDEKINKARQARQEEEARDQERRNEWNRKYNESREKARKDWDQKHGRGQNTPPEPPPAPKTKPYDAEAETHPEVKKFNEYAGKVNSNIQDTATIAKTKQRLLELNNLRKRTKEQNIEFAVLSNRLAVHSNGLQGFARDFEAATGKKMDFNTSSDLEPKNIPTGREEVLNAVREHLRGGVEFDKAFPESKTATGPKKGSHGGFVDFGPKRPKTFGGKKTASGAAELEKNVSRETFTDPRENNDVARTSLNQVSALLRKADFKEGQTNVDMGGGKYDKGTEFLASKGVQNHVFDPYNRTSEHNQGVHDRFTSKPADTATVANVLNVIEDPAIRQDVIRNAGNYVKPGGKIYFDMYEGDRSGVGAKTSTGSYQNNRPVPTYLEEIQKVFPNAKTENGIIVATKGRFSAFDEPKPSSKSEQAAPSTTPVPVKPAARTGGSAPRKGSHGGFIDFKPLPPKSGAGPVGRLLHHGPEVVNAANKWDAAHVSAQVRAEIMTRNLLPKTLTEVQRGTVGEILIGQRIDWLANNSTSPEARANFEKHPQRLTPAEVATLASDPVIKDAIDWHKDYHVSEFNKLAKPAGVPVDSDPNYIRLISTKVLKPGNSEFSPTQGGRASWESKARPQSSGARKRAMGTAEEYVTDVGEIYRYDLRDKEPKASLNDLWRTLDKQGLVATRPRGEEDWMPPEGYTADEVQGKYSSAPPDIKSRYGEKSVVHLPLDINEVMNEITQPEKGDSGHRGLETAKRISRMLVWAQLGTNPMAVAGHIYRQTAMVRGATEYADVKASPLKIVGSALTPLGVAMKGAIIGFRDVDAPGYQKVIQDLVEANAISPRSMEMKAPKSNNKLIKGAAQYQHFLHDAMFGMPHGKGVNGWAIRAVLEGELVRRQYEGNEDPERMREFASNFGFYTRRLAPYLGPLAQLNSFVRTTAARYQASAKQMVGVSGLKAPGGPKDQAAQWVGTLALKALGVIVGLVGVNKLMSGKYPWENGKGHELDINMGHGVFMPLGSLLFMVEAETAMQVTGMRSRMHREKAERDPGVHHFGAKYKPAKSSNPAAEALGDLGVGMGNTMLSLAGSPALQAGFGAIGRKPYLEYVPGQVAPVFMPSQPAKAEIPQEVYNYAKDLTGIGQAVPDLGYADTNYTRAMVDYLTQHAFQSDHSRPAKIKKFGR